MKEFIKYVIKRYNVINSMKTLFGMLILTFFYPIVNTISRIREFRTNDKMRIEEDDDEWCKTTGC